PFRAWRGSRFCVGRATHRAPGEGRATGTDLAPDGGHVEAQSRGPLLGSRALNAATEISLLVARELRRSVRSLKGIILGIITLVGAVLTSLMVVWMQGNDLARAGGSEALAEANRQMIEQHT